MTRTNIAVRTRDLKKLTDKWGEGREYSPVLLKSLVARAVANYFGIDTLTQIVEPIKSKPGRPVGVRGCKKGTGRRSAGGWKQVEAGEAGAWLEVLSEMLQQKHGWAMRPSAELTLAIVARAEPKDPSQWGKRMPTWAMNAWVKSQEHRVSVPGVVYASCEDSVLLTEEQEKELEDARS